MRRRELYIAKGAAVGFVGIAFMDILLQWFEHRKDRIPFTWESYNGKRTLKNAFIGGATGAGAGYLIYKAKLSEEAKHPFNSDEYLRKVIFEEHLKSDPVLFKKYLSYKSKCKEVAKRKVFSKACSSTGGCGLLF